MLAPATSIVLTAIQQGQIEKLTRDGGTPQRVAARYRIILLARQGKTNVAIAGQLGLSRPTVLAARAAFAKNGLNAIVGVRKRKRSARVLTVRSRSHPGTDPADSRGHAQDAPPGRFHALECAHARQASGRVADDHSSGVAEA